MIFGNKSTLYLVLNARGSFYQLCLASPVDGKFPSAFCHYVADAFCRATMATNIPDFTRYLKKEQGVYWQVPFLPLIQLVLGLFGIISTSASMVVYGEYIWDPLALAAKWDGPSGRAGAFFVGFCWVIAQIGTNLSANVVCKLHVTLSSPTHTDSLRSLAPTI